MSNTKENKREKVLVTLPEIYINALDNKIDNMLIRTRGDAIMVLLSELQKTNPNSLVFEEKQTAFPLPKWLTSDILNNIIKIFGIKDDADKITVEIIISQVSTKIKKADSISQDDWNKIRKMRAEAKIAEQGAPQT